MPREKSAFATSVSAQSSTPFSSRSGQTRGAVDSPPEPPLETGGSVAPDCAGDPPLGRPPEARPPVGDVPPVKYPSSSGTNVRSSTGHPLTSSTSASEHAALKRRSLLTGTFMFGAALVLQWPALRRSASAPDQEKQSQN